MAFRMPFTSTRRACLRPESICNDLKSVKQNDEIRTHNSIEIYGEFWASKLSSPLKQLGHCWRNLDEEKKLFVLGVFPKVIGQNLNDCEYE